MPRKPRILLDGGYYHILTRGNDRKKVFRDKQDYHFFLKTMRRYLEKFQINILHYCLMPNHVHLLIRAQKAKDLPKFMQATLQVYANYFRNKYNAAGFMFQNRYKSHLIDKESYLLECARYIERNPLRAELSKDVFEYKWSSLSVYAGRSEDRLIKVKNPLYLELAETESERQNRYLNYVSEERPYEHIVDEAFRIG